MTKQVELPKPNGKVRTGALKEEYEFTADQMRQFREEGVKEALEQSAKEIVQLHQKLAGETLRADSGWDRYEAANKMCLNQQNEIDGLNEVISELRKEDERLDYVLCNGQPLKHEFMYRYQCKGTMNWHDDPRDAIDAAMEADKWIVSDTSTQGVG